MVSADRFSVKDDRIMASVYSWSTSLGHLGRQLRLNIRWLLGSHLVELFRIEFGMPFGGRFWSFGTPFGQCFSQWLGTVRLRVILSTSMWSSLAVISVAARSRSSLPGSYLDNLSWRHSVGDSVHLVVIFNLFRDQFGSDVAVVRYRVRNRLRCHIALIRHGSGSFHVSSSGAFTILLDVRRMLGELIVWDRGVHSLALLRVCFSTHL